MAAAQEKKTRSCALSFFTRCVNSLSSLLDNQALTHLVLPQCEKLTAALEKLYTAHDVFLQLTDIDIDIDKLGISYLDDTSKTYDDIVARYATCL